MDKLPPEYFGCSVPDDPTCPEMPYHTDMELEMMALAAAEQADRYYLSLACN